MPSAYRARCISIASASGLSRAASVPNTSGNSRPVTAPSCPNTSPSVSPRSRASGPGGHLQRQHLLDLGPAALAYLTELTHRRPQIWIHNVERLHDLLQTHGDAALRRAFERGLGEQAIGAEYIAHYLGDTSPSLPFDPVADRPPTIAASPLPRAGR